LFSTAAVVLTLIAITLAVVIVPNLQSSYLAMDRNGSVGSLRLLKQTEVSLNDLPAIATALSHGSAKVRYAALIFGTPDRPSDDDVINLQLSFEDGKVGFDWVLLAPRNIEDQQHFTEFARAHHLEPVTKSMNGVSYLRVESDDVAKFAASVVTEMYHLPPGEPLGFVHVGFDWPRN
jgi:hypothetical protein